MDVEVSTLIYFLLTLILIVLIPWTYHSLSALLSPSPQIPLHPCRCNNCNSKNTFARRPRLKQYFFFVLMLFTWAGVLLLSRNAGSLETAASFDPFEVLGLDVDASVGDIKDSYRRLSYVHHPDRGGDSEMFVAISRAYKTLMDPEKRLNWEKHGDPDGPSKFVVGTVLPDWLARAENRRTVMGLYVLLLFVGVPVVVLLFWRGERGVREESRRMMGYFLLKHGEMSPERLMVCLSALQEFDPSHSPDVVLRYSDGGDMPRLLALLPRALHTQGENIFKQPYSLKARALLYAHSLRLPLDGTLSTDQTLVLRKCPLLMAEFVSVFMSLVSLSHMGQVPHDPPVPTLASLIRLSALTLQALPFSDPLSSFLQLPHLDLPTARRLTSRKKLRSIHDLFSLNSDSLRSLLDLSHPHFDNFYSVLSSLPLLTIHSIDISPEIVPPQSCISFDLLLLRRGPSSLVVHCPFFPDQVSESWAVYISHGPHLMTPCLFVNDLVEEKRVNLVMTSPSKPGKYDFVVCVRSRCYVDLDVTRRVQIVVDSVRDISTDSD